MGPSLAIALCLLASVSEPARSTRYYAVFFSFENAQRHSLHNAHAFATFLKVPAHDQANRPTIDYEHCTISWLDADKRCPPFVWLPARGVNLTLEETLALARERSLQVSIFGPYEIHPELYRRAVQRVHELQNGNYRWRNLDFVGRRQGHTFHCVHAVSDLDIEHGYLHTYAKSGQRAALRIVQHLSHWFVDNTPRPWVLDLLPVKELLPDCQVNRAPGS